MEKKKFLHKVGLVVLSLLLLVSIAALAACGKGEKTPAPTIPTEVTASPTPTPTAKPTSTPTATPELTPTKTATPSPAPTLPPGYVAEDLVLMVTPEIGRASCRERV